MNPSIRKIKERSLLLLPNQQILVYGFDYDSASDHYKVVIFLWNNCGNFLEVKVNTLGTKILKNIEVLFPFGIVPY